MEVIVASTHAAEVKGHRHLAGVECLFEIVVNDAIYHRIDFKIVRLIREAFVEYIQALWRYKNWHPAVKLLRGKRNIFWAFSA